VKVAQVSPPSLPANSGVAQHIARLSESLGDLDIDCGAAPARADVVHLHYSPFAFGRTALAVLPLLRRLRQPGSPVVVTIHEARVGFRGALGNPALAAFQALSLRALCALSSARIVTTGRWLPFLSGPAEVVAAGSVLPRHHPGGPPVEAREEIGYIPSGHPGQLAGSAEEAARTAAAQSGLKLIAAGGGDLSAEEFATSLGRCAVLVLPYIDGVSGRRTSFLSGLQAGAAVVSTFREPMTDFSVSGLRLVDPGDPGALVAASTQLALEPDQRGAVSAAGRRVFDAELSWPVLAARVAAVYARASR
jgi:glycosyltransferase involved in cell wall biosynthesis